MSYIIKSTSPFVSIKLTDAILSDAVLDRDRLPIKIKSIL